MLLVTGGLEFYGTNRVSSWDTLVATANPGDNIIQITNGSWLNPGDDIVISCSYADQTQT